MLAEKTRYLSDTLNYYFPERIEMLVLDLDECALDGDTYTEIAKRRCGIGNLHLIQAVYTKYVKERDEGNPLAYLNMKRDTFTLWTTYGQNPFTLDELNYIINSIPYRDGVKETVECCKQNGIIVGAISASIDLLADRVKRELELDFAVANTQVIVDLNGLIVDLNQIQDFAEEKWRQLNLILERFQIPIDQVLAVGDGYTDVVIAEKSGRLIAVASTHQPLIKHAIDNVATFQEFSHGFIRYNKLLRLRGNQGA